MSRIVVLTRARDREGLRMNAISHMLGHITAGLPPQLRNAREIVRQCVTEHETSWSTHAYFVAFEVEQETDTVAVVLFTEVTVLPSHGPRPLSEADHISRVMSEVVKAGLSYDSPDDPTANVRVGNTYSTTFMGGKLELTFTRDESDGKLKPRARIETPDRFDTSVELCRALMRLLDCPLDIAVVTTFDPSDPE